MSDLFRKKSMDRINSPEELNDYIRVTSTPVWLILLAIVFVLVGTLVWGTIGFVDEEMPDGTTKSVHPITFVTN
ncbi:MAG: hypothetical protein K6G67_08510 [Lachnospiraceae bacterium]|nr:hypothetical protein [Lachnospiraceae bacterium]